MTQSKNERATKAVNTRVVKRETHSSRALTAVILTVGAVVVIGYLVAETIASLIGDRYLLMPANQLWHNVWHAPSVLPLWGLVLGGLVCIILALILLWKALAPGSLNRHQIASERTAMVVDDAVIAAGVSKAVRDQFGLDSSQVSTSVDRRRVRVTVTPSSGVDMDYAQMEKFVVQLVSQYRLQPNVSASLKRADGGVIAG